MDDFTILIIIWLVAGLLIVGLGIWFAVQWSKDFDEACRHFMREDD